MISLYRLRTFDLIVLFKGFQPCGGVNHDRLLSWLEESLKDPTLKGRMTLRIFSWYEGDEDSDDEPVLVPSSHFSP